MSETLFPDHEARLAPCPKNICDCGYYSATTMNEDENRGYGERLTKSEEKNIINSIHAIHTLDEFQLIRKQVRESF
jgi:hypothetical protein